MKAAVSVAAGMAIASLTFAATPAHADEFDFASAIERDGGYYESLTDVINLGHLSCRELRSGVPVQQVLNDIRSGLAVEQFQPPPRLFWWPPLQHDDSEQIHILFVP
jgi:Protein of unknown function (DUF732)